MNKKLLAKILSGAALFVLALSFGLSLPKADAQTTYYKILNLPAGFTAISLNSYRNPTTVGIVAGSTEKISIKYNNERFAEITIPFTRDYDFSTFKGGVDKASQKAFVSGLATSVGPNTPFYLYVPRVSSTESRVIACPSVTSFSQITSTCSGGVVHAYVSGASITQFGAVDGNFWRYSGTSDVGIMPGTGTSLPLPPPACVRANPQITLTPTSQSGAAGTSLVYKLAITNKDSGSCAESTFTITPTLPSANWKQSTTTVSLKPGYGTSRQITVTSDAGATVGTYNFSEKVTNSSLPAYTATASGSYVVQTVTPPPAPTCTRASPTLTVTPSTQSGAAGSKLFYGVIITNNDTAECGSSQFSATPTLPSANWKYVMQPISIPAGTGLYFSLEITSDPAGSIGNYAFPLKVINTTAPSPSAITSITYEISSSGGSTVVNGTCGTSNGTTVSSVPTSGLCSTGTASSISGSGPWTWNCVGQNGGTTANCSASITPQPVNGVCGSSNGGSFSSIPTTNLCSVGTVTALSGTGPWTWGCTGLNGGTAASCSASLIPVIPPSPTDTGWPKIIPVPVSMNPKTTTDSVGNTYVTANFTGAQNFNFSGTSMTTPASSSGVYVAKVNADGSYAWKRPIVGLVVNNNTSPIYSITTDLNNNVYIAGQFRGSINFNAGGTDNKTSSAGSLFVTKINADGSYGWTKTAGGTGGSWAYDVTADSAGNVYVTGEFEQTVNFNTSGSDNKTAGLYDAFLLKINADGTHGWVRTMGGSKWDRSTGVVTDSANNVYLVGIFTDSASFNNGADVKTKSTSGLRYTFLTKINANNSYGWTKVWDPASFDMQQVAVDPSDNVYVLGTIPGMTNGKFNPDSDVITSGLKGSSIYLTKMNANGTYGWTKIHSSVIGYGITVTLKQTAIDTDSAGNIYITGMVDPVNGETPRAGKTINFNPDGSDIKTMGTSPEIFITKWNAGGTYGWTKIVGGTSTETATDLALNSANVLHLAGTFMGSVNFDPAGSNIKTSTSTTIPDIFLAKFDSNGKGISTSPNLGASVLNAPQPGAQNASKNTLIGLGIALVGLVGFLGYRLKMK